MTLTLTDLFCGAGGSSTGAIAIPAVSVKCASNHWKLAIETHNSNHPNAAHIHADLSQIDPRYFPTTDLLWASPSCTKHSVAQGKKLNQRPDLFGDTLPDEAAERSRATMWDVVRFSEYHQYEAVIVENVVDVIHWPPMTSWLLAMQSPGYSHQIVYLNSMHAQLYGPGAPQSRDRLYVVFWREGNRAPQLTRAVSPPPSAPNADQCAPCTPGNGPTADPSGNTAPNTSSGAQISPAATRSWSRCIAPQPTSSIGRCAAPASATATAH
jgi:DNA (cytosine-5)-methyltransferase 1